MAAVRMIECLLCGETKPHKSRYLCLACYQNPLSKNLKIPVNYRVARLDRSEPEMSTETLDEPTRHPPGSEGKIEAMAARWAAGRPLFHPQDAGWEGLPWGNPVDTAAAADID